MKKRIFFVCAALLCVWTAMAQYGSSEVRVLVSPDRSDWTYQVGEKCTFTIRVLKAQNFLQDDVTIDYELGPEMYPVEKKTGVALKNGELKPGTRLPSEPELAFDFGVSRGILREALTILQAKGIIYRKPKEGTFIAPDVLETISGSWEISVKEATYLDLIEVRECFEPRVVEKVIGLASDEEIKELMDLVEGKKETSKGDSLDYYFHYKLAELSRNVVFANFIDTYYDIIDEFKSKSNSKLLNLLLVISIILFNIASLKKSSDIFLGL